MYAPRPNSCTLETQSDHSQRRLATEIKSFMNKFRANSTRSFSKALSKFNRLVTVSVPTLILLLLLTPLAAWSGFVPNPSATSDFSIFIPPSHNPPLPGELIVRFQRGTASILLNELRNQVGGYSVQPPTLIGQRLGVALLKEAAPDLRETFERHGVWAGDAIDPAWGIYRLMASTEADLGQFLYDIKQSQRVFYAEPDYPVLAFRDANDPFYRRGDQWGLAKISAPDAWDITTGSDTITIAIIDSGVADEHPELAGKVLPGQNFLLTPPTTDSNDDAGHGTFVAGIAAAKGNNGYGIAGVSWGAKILPVKVLNSQGSTSNAVVAMGINYAAEQRAQIINLSLGTSDRSQAVYDAVSKAYDQGLVIVSAAGNDGKADPQYPASFDQVISVGASTPLDRPAVYSNSGPEISIIAPGDGIFSLSWARADGQIFGFDKGTSFAAPYVSGTAALMLSVNKYLTNSQIKNMLEGTADFPPSLVTGSSQTGGASSTITTPKTTIPFPGSTPSTITSSTPVYLPPTTTTTVTPTQPPNPFQTTGFDPRLGFGRLNAYKAVLAAQRNDLLVSRRGQVKVKISGNINPQDVLVALSPGDSRVPNIKGDLVFANLPPGTYRLLASSTKYGLVGLADVSSASTAYTFQIQGTGAETQQTSFDFSAVSDLLESGKAIGAFASTPAILPTLGVRYFPETSHILREPFKKFWENNGGVTTFGYPISEQFIENGARVQYFERVICEFQPDLAGTSFEIQVRRLGSELTKVRKDLPFQAVEPPTADALTKEKINYYKETKHSLRGNFLNYWQNNGGAATIGLPISEPFNEDGRLVQYFEKQRLEYYPDLVTNGYPVLGSLLARDYAKVRGLLGKT